MTQKNQKLELTWIGKENQPELEPRIFIEDPEKSYGHPPRPSQEGNKMGISQEVDKMGVSQEGNKHTPNPLSRGEYKRPLLGREAGVRTNKDGEL